MKKEWGYGTIPVEQQPYAEYTVQIDAEGFESKEVAGSEIYATWPDDTIRANVLAIMSFTLNRVYTEWYRNAH